MGSGFLFYPAIAFWEALIINPVLSALPSTPIWLLLSGNLGLMLLIDTTGDGTHNDQENEIDEVVEGMSIHDEVHDIYPALQGDDL